MGAPGSELGMVAIDVFFSAGKCESCHQMHRSVLSKDEAFWVFGTLDPKPYKFSHIYVLVSRQVGIVQTAYANGASTQYIREALPGCGLERTPTGVKHLHAAAERFDVGIYWEANGHGTILFGAAFVTRLHKVRRVLGCISGSGRARPQVASTFELAQLRTRC